MSATMYVRELVPQAACLPVFARQLRATRRLDGPAHEGLLLEGHVSGWRRGSAPHIASAAAQMPCYRGAGNLQRTTCTTAAVDNSSKVYLRSTQILKPAGLSSQVRQTDRAFVDAPQLLLT